MAYNLRVDFDDSIIEKKEYNWGFTVPSTPNFPELQPERYVVYLPEIPYLADPVNFPIEITGLNRVTGRLPFPGEFRTVESINNLVPHRIEFSESQKGNIYTIHFFGIGSIYP